MWIGNVSNVQNLHVKLVINYKTPITVSQSLESKNKYINSYNMYPYNVQ